MNMRWFRVLIVAFVVVVLDTALLPAFSVRGIRPDLAFVYVLFIAFYGNRDDVFIACWIVGMMKDFLSVGTLGAFALLYAVFGYQASSLVQRLFKENILITLMITLPAAFLVHGLYLLGVFFSYPHVAWAAGLRSALICAIYTTLVVLLLMPILRKAQSILGIRPRPVLLPQEQPESEQWPCL